MSELASALVGLGIPVASSRAGLLETPEVSLALACYRRLVDPSDSLASAEILTLLTGQSPEYWLENRCSNLLGGGRSWNDNAHPVLEKLFVARDKVGAQSMAETLSLAIHASGILKAVASWSEEKRLTDHRLANLQRLSDLVGEYEDHCSASGEPGTAGGFVLWLKNQEQSFADTQAENPGDAVNVLTYHASKGLEWPVVICHSLNNSMKVSLYGVRVASHSSAFDWNNPLKGRQVRYWPNPFPDQRGKDPLTDILNTTELWKKAEAAELQERLQLLYVGITRARDQLVFTNEGKQAVGAWLAELQSDLLPLSDTVSLPSGDISVETKQLEASEGLAAKVARPKYWPEIALPNSIGSDLYHHQPSSESKYAGATVSVVEDFKERIAVPANAAMDELGNAVHHALAMLFVNSDLPEETIQRVLDSYVPGQLVAERVIAQFRNLKQWIDNNYPGAKVMTEVPMKRNLLNGALQQGRIDLLLYYGGKYVIIDHKSNPQPKERWKQIAMEHSGQLSAYSEALSSISGREVIANYVFFAVAGGLVEVSF